jgi:Zn-dependent M28 family amino/carboxypeptidase
VRGQTDEVVVYTAHVDHLGVGEPIAGDAIYNGALDDAIGVAGILEIARAFAALPQRPRRSIVFLATTAEEKGLLGSEYFVGHPTVPLDTIVADINVDGLTAQWEPFDVIPIGAEHSSLAGDVTAAARAAGLGVSEDPDPDQVYFIRSDQYNFVRAGVPSVFPGAGYRDASGATAKNRAISSAWGAAHYHRPSDEWRPEYRGAWAAKEARFDFLLGLAIANARERPHWNPGDELAPDPAHRRRLPW